MNIDEYEDLVFTHTKEPSNEKTSWAPGGKLCLLFAEFRDLEIITYNIWNLAHVYGGCDVGLIIVYSGVNEKRIKDATRNWKGVRYVKAFDDNITVDEYSKLFVSSELWEHFSSFEYVLTNQWDSYLFRKIPEKFFEYDFVGSPCGHFYILYGNRIINICSSTCECDRCKSGDHSLKESNFVNSPYKKWFMFNGGFSLRKVDSIKKICREKRYSGEAEDIYFAISELSRPTREEAKEFGVQDFPYDGVPVGCHQIWLRNDKEYVKNLFSQIDSTLPPHPGKDVTGVSS